MPYRRSEEPEPCLPAGARLQALHLRPAAGGWVPETVTDTATATRPETEAVSATARVPQAATVTLPDAASLPDRRPDPLGVSTVEAPVAEARPPLPVSHLARGWLKDRLPLWAHQFIDRLTVGSAVTGVAVLVSIVMVGLIVFHRHSSPSYPSSYDSSSSGSAPGGTSYSAPVVTSAPTSSQDASSIVVDVGGRVRKPGLVTLPPGARVADALSAAGGPLRHKEIATLDLAARVTDGQLLLIGVSDPATSSPGGAAGAPSTPSSTAPVELNSATLEQLETLPGVGPVTAQKIVDWRTAHSGFTSVEQLQQVSGIGPATYAELSPLVSP